MFRQLRALLVIFATGLLLVIGPAYAQTQTQEIAGVSGEASSQVSCALLDSMLGGAGISLQSFNLAEQSFNLSEQSFNLSEQSFNLSEQSFNLAEQGFNISEQGFNVAEQTFNLSEQGFNLAEQTFNLAEQSFNLSEQGFTVSEQGFNLSEQGFNLAEQTYNTSTETGEPTTFTWYSPVFNWIGVDPDTGEPVNTTVLMNYSNPENIAAEVGIHTVPAEYYNSTMPPEDKNNYPKYLWGGDLVANNAFATTPGTLYGDANVAVIFVDVGDYTDPSTHMYKVSKIFDGLVSEANIPHLTERYIDISDPAIGYRVSTERDADGNIIPDGYIGIEGALRNEVNDLLSMDPPVTNIVINMSLAFLPCSDMILTPSGQEIEWNIDDFIEAYNQANNPSEPQTLKQILPVAECVFTPDDGKTWYARFGFINTYDDPMRLDSGGPGNRFVPNPQNRDQPSILEPGTHRGVLEVKFSKPSITWELTGPQGVAQSATAYIPNYAPSDLISWPNPVGSDAVMSRDTALPCADKVTIDGTDYFGLGQNSTLNPVGSAPNADGSLSEPRFPVEPIFQCIREDSTGRYAVFSYYNWNDGFEDPYDPSLNRPARTVYVPSTGQNNKISPNPGNRGQTTYFLPGGQPSVFEIPFKAGEKDFTWTLINDWVNQDGNDAYAQSISDNIPDTMLVEAYPLEDKTCTETLGGTDLGNYLAGLGGVPEDEVLNVLIYLLSVETKDDTTNTTGLKSLLAEYLAGSKAKPSDYNIAVVASSGNYRPWFNVMWGIGNVSIVNGVAYFEDEVIPPLAPARWDETIAVSASLGNDAWALLDDDNNNAELLANGDFAARTVPEDGDGTVNLWEDVCYDSVANATNPECLDSANQPIPGEDENYQWMRWFFSHDGDIMARGAGYNIGTLTAPQVIAGTSFASPGVAYVLAQYFSFPDACTFPENGSIVYPPLRDKAPEVWPNHPLEGYLGEGNAYLNPLNCDIQTNEPPVAEDDTATTDEDTPTVIDVLANDSDPEGDEISVNSIDDISINGGTVTLNAGGTVTYTPALNWSGTDTFTYDIIDEWGSVSNRATVTITVNPVNDAPITQDDSYITDEDTNLVVSMPGVLANDTDVEGDSLTAILVSSTSHGVLTLNSDGGVFYTPDANFNGEDSFTYKACDSYGACSYDPADANTSPAKVNITVNPIPDAPVAYDQSILVPLNAIDYSITLEALDVDDDDLAFSLDMPASHGTAVVHTDGSATYTPQQNYVGKDSFTFMVCTSGLCDIGTVEILVLPESCPLDLTVNADKPELAAPFNHQMVEVTIENAPDGYRIVAVDSDEPVVGSGGDKSPDAIIAPDGQSVELRREREGKGDGRVYTITVVLYSGETPCATTTDVLVDHDARDSGKKYDATKES